MKRIHLDELHDFSVRTMEACGMNREDACTVADVLVGTDTFGGHGHGQRQPRDGACH